MVASKIGDCIVNLQELQHEVNQVIYPYLNGENFLDMNFCEAPMHNTLDSNEMQRIEQILNTLWNEDKEEAFKLDSLLEQMYHTCSIVKDFVHYNNVDKQDKCQKYMQHEIDFAMMGY